MFLPCPWADDVEDLGQCNPDTVAYNVYIASDLRLRFLPLIEESLEQICAVKMVRYVPLPHVSVNHEDLVHSRPSITVIIVGIDDGEVQLNYFFLVL